MFKIKWIYWFPQFVSFCHYTVLKEALSCGHVGDKKSFILAKENDDALPLVKKKNAKAKDDDYGRVVHWVIDLLAWFVLGN